MERPVIYVSKGGPLHNAQETGGVFLALIQLGFAPLNGVGAVAERTSSLPLTHAEWLDVDLAFVRRADAVLRLPGESAGADTEVAEAKSYGVPVFTSIDEARAWIEGGDARRSLVHPWIQSILPPRKNGGRHTTEKLGRWVTRGIAGLDGKNHKLAAVKIGGQWAVRTADLRAFLAAVGDAATR